MAKRKAKAVKRIEAVKAWAAEFPPKALWYTRVPGLKCLRIIPEADYRLLKAAKGK